VRAGHLYGERGATMNELAEAFNVSSSTIYNWLNRYPEFNEAVHVNADVFNARVERTLARSQPHSHGPSTGLAHGGAPEQKLEVDRELMASGALQCRATAPCCDVNAAETRLADFCRGPDAYSAFSRAVRKHHRASGHICLAPGD
jgi:transposase-like protein